MATIFRGPTFAQSVRRKINRPDVWPNLLVATLAVVAAAPFKPNLFQQPYKARIAQSAELPPNMLVLGITAAPIPTGRTDLPGAQAREKFSQLTELPPNSLIGGIPIGGTPFTPRIWQQGYEPRLVTADVPPNMLIGGIPAGDSPGWNDSSTQQYRQRYASPGELPRSLLTSTLVQTAAPFSPGDFSARQSREPLTPFEIPPNTLVRGITAAPPPFNLLDWTGVTAARSVSAQVFPNLLGTTLAITQAQPFVQGDWQQPFRRAGITADIPPNTTLRGIPAATVPFNLTDWTRVYPRAVVRVIDPPNLSASTLAPAAQAPFSLDDWTPAVRARISQVTEIPPNMLVRGIPAAPMPFSQTQWQCAFGWRFGQFAIGVPSLMASTLAPIGIADVRITYTADFDVLRFDADSDDVFFVAGDDPTRFDS
jgi:hypothetical protein